MQSPSSIDTAVEQSSTDAVPSPEASGDSRWRRAVVTSLSVWGSAALAYFLINILFWTTRSQAGPRLSGMIAIWSQWDTGHYVTIAQRGYDSSTASPAFFPLYPMLMRLLEPVLPGGMLSAGLIISHAACVVALVLLYRLTEDLFDSAVAHRATAYLMAFPFAFFLCAAYNESTFLMFSLAALYCMRRQYWWAAGVFAGLASATRQAGILLALAFVVEYLRRRDWRLRSIRFDALAVLLVPAGTAAYALYCWRAFGDPLKFAHIQSLWGRELSWPGTGTQRAVDEIFKAASEGRIFQSTVVLNVVDLAAVLVTLGLLVLSVFGRWSLGADSVYLVIFAWAGLLLALLFPMGEHLALHSTPRFVLEMIPAFLVLARIGANRHAERFYLMPAIAVQGALLLAFFSGVWLS